MPISRHRIISNWQANLLSFVLLSLIFLLFEMFVKHEGSTKSVNGGGIVIGVVSFNKTEYPKIELRPPGLNQDLKLRRAQIGDIEPVCYGSHQFLKDSLPKPTRGCREMTCTTDIELLCRTPIHVDCGMTLSQTRDGFYRNVGRTTLRCPGRTDFGSQASDGVWSICLNAPFDLKANSCLVYSIGINNEWSFDDAIANAYGCEIHSFDPSMAVADHKRGQHITFHNMGVLGHGERFAEAKKKGWKMLKLIDIMRMLGHQDKVIDILKIDIEYSEWDAFEDALKDGALKNVKQIATELHVWIDHLEAYVRFHRMLVALENAGFEKWYVHYKLNFSAISQETGFLTHYHYQQDTGYINVNFL